MTKSADKSHPANCVHFQLGSKQIKKPHANKLSVKLSPPTSHNLTQYAVLTNDKGSIVSMHIKKHLFLFFAIFHSLRKSQKLTNQCTAPFSFLFCRRNDMIGLRDAAHKILYVYILIDKNHHFQKF